MTLRACRHNILALNDDVLMMNRTAQQELDPQDQVRLLDHLRDSPRKRPMSGEVDLPSGARCRIYARQVPGRDAGLITRVHLHRPTAAGAITMAPTGPLPGIAGSEPLWRQCCRAVRDHRDRGTWICVEGEPGTGKCAVVRAVCHAHRPDQQVRVIAADEIGSDRDRRERLRTELLSRHGSLVLRGAHLLTASKLTEPTCLLRPQSGVSRGRRS